ncbi:MAG: hypothetical protein B9S34_12490 [Opitutia bacterium Tous-C1TDCM]|nr:MAG: hypothetical protein B9S34_12490 [Opitutae bacterium Tous-C1TDCM]
MIHFLVAFGLLLHGAAWGAGAALLAMPRRWARFWPVLVFPAGWWLQSLAVWLGTYAGWAGTASYAWPAQVLPLGLLGLGLWRHGGRAAWTDLGRFGLVGAAVAGCLALLILPLALASRGLTTVSLGSCDAADYAAGARVLMEFARDERGGFLGLTEVVQVQSVDNVADYWLRLNHFTPAALLALNGTVLGCAPHELASILAAALLASALPVVFWVARAVVGYSGGVSLIVAGLFGISPAMWYAYAHVAPGQLLAAPAIALATWSGVALWRGRLTWRRGLAFAGVLAIAYGLMLGSYNFILTVALVPAAAYAGGLALVRGEYGRFGRWLAVMLAPLGPAAAVMAERVAGLAERFTLLRTYDFGWPIPALSAEGWLGMVQGGDLAAWPWPGVRWALSALVVGLLAWAGLRSAQQGKRALWLVVALAVPVLAGYLFLQERGARLGTNASYDAYKLFAVFFPLLLPALCWWVTLRRSRKLHEWLMVCAVAGIVVTLNLAACGMFVWRLSRPPLRVEAELRDLRRIEAMPEVASVNLMIPDMWSRLWANAFLLRKPHYFPTHTYEGRLNTALRGEWDLQGGTVRTRLPGAATRELNPRFSLVDTRHPEFLRAWIDEALDTGWHGEEYLPGGERWRWTAGAATVQLTNPHAYPLAMTAMLDGAAAVPRTLALTRAGGEDRPGVPVGIVRGTVRLPVPGIPPGASVLRLQTTPPAAPVPGDGRPLGVSVHRLTLVPGP